MTVLAIVTLDTSAIAALGTLVVAIAGAGVAWLKVKPETESIATRTTLEVIEAQRQQLVDTRQEAAMLRKSLRERDEELEALQRRFTSLRLEFDALEAELRALRAA